MRSILHVITGLENGGAEAVLYRLVTNDKENRHSVISLMGLGKYGSLLQQEGITVHCLDMPKGGITYKGVVSLWKMIRRERPDILQTWMYHADFVGGIVGYMAGVKKIYWCIHNSTLLRKATPWKTLLVMKLCAMLSYVLPKKIISCAQNAIDVNTSEGYSASKFVLVPNGYDLSRFKPDDSIGTVLRRKWGIPGTTFLLGMVARFDPQKDIQNLLRALKILMSEQIDFHLLLVGQGIDKNNAELTGWIQHESVAEYVSLVGEQDDIPAVMNTFDILVLSSRGEAFPNVLCEAMACGTPCVSTTVGDAALIVDNTGWLVPPNNSSLLADGILKALSAWQDKNGWKIIQQNARKRIDMNFGVEKMVKGYQQVWGIK